MMTITCPQLLMSLSVTGGVELTTLKDDYHLSSAVDVSVAGGAGLAVLSSRMTITCPQLLMFLPVAGGAGLAVLKNDRYMSSAVDVSLSGRWCGAGCPQG